MGWTGWRKIATHDHWFAEALDWDGAACYELSIAGVRGGNRKIVYVGETINEKKRLTAYAQYGSHLSEIIQQHLSDGWHLYYRARAAKDKKHAVEMQNALLAKFDYDWNIILNS